MNAIDGAMVAWKPPPDVIDALLVDGGEDADQLHLTLSYLGKASELDPSQPDLARGVIASICRSTSLLPGNITGAAVFQQDEGGFAYVALVDVPGLAVLQPQVVAALESVGLTPPRNHGYTAHITLAYTETVPRIRVPNLPVVIDGLCVVVAGHETSYPFGG